MLKGIPPRSNFHIGKIEGHFTREETVQILAIVYLYHHVTHFYTYEVQKEFREGLIVEFAKIDGAAYPAGDPLVGNAGVSLISLGILYHFFHYLWGNPGEYFLLTSYDRGWDNRHPGSKSKPSKPALELSNLFSFMGVENDIPSLGEYAHQFAFAKQFYSRR